MVDATPLDTSWTLTLPTLDGLFAHPAASSSKSKSKSRLRSSLGGLTRAVGSLFAGSSSSNGNGSSAPTLPSASTLDPVVSLAHSPDPVDGKALIAALRAVGAFATDLRAAVASLQDDADVNDDGEDAEIEIVIATGEMLLAFLCGAALCARFLCACGGTPITDNSDAADDADALRRDIHAALRQCLEGTFILLPTLRALHHPPPNVTAAVLAVERAVLGSLFPDAEPSEPTVVAPSFAPILEHARSLVESVNAAARLNTGRTRRNSASAPFDQTAAARAHALLGIYAGCVAGVERLPSPAQQESVLDSKHRAERERCRSFRVALEVNLLATDLAFSLVSLSMDAVTRRAQELLTASDDEGDREEDDDDIAWEDKAEAGLVSCLSAATELIQHHRSGVLVDELVREDWLGVDDSDEADDESDGEDGHHQHGSTNGVNGTSNGNGHYASDDEDDEYDDDETASTSTRQSELEGPPTPLRTLFTLHDQYEEQRVGVWMQLAPDLRPKMGAFLRGADGHLRQQWYEFGAALLLDFSPDDLLDYGLSRDKLDKLLDGGGDKKKSPSKRGRSRK
ncbi:uncharacterized protein LOC62_03G004249 [Vanrija pseudolonga]|uniref:Uncharacterized protein n=1 Tax=Vanrija pseudolonga TaxID=143232 RepID=A0AAF0YAC3_9TREE|nr:hypothetical protein LOC62_03G004249 [Vanrija pseudolonga]